MYKEIEDLLVRAKSGDVNAKELLLKKVRGLIINQVKKYNPVGIDYEDLIQDGYIVTLEAIENYDQNRGVYFLGYLKAMLRFYYLEKGREKTYTSLNIVVGDDNNFELIDFLEDDFNLEDFIVEKEEVDTLKEALNSLTSRQRKVVVLYYLKNYSIGEVASELGVSYRTVVNTKVTAVNKLKKYF